ncbi:MAG: NAD(+)/NADH kinase [Anaerolineales bacterium]|nr:NAD(+)/NADH kinase [Anaerolineales bacterium]
MSGQKRFANILVVAHPELAEAIKQAEEITSYLQKQGIAAACGLLTDQEIREAICKKNIDLFVALGGDGTMLRAGNICAPCNIPILGINMGKFGFLAEIRNEEWREVFPRLLEGDFWIEHRMMLRAEHWREDRLLGNWEVLNEVVVSRGHSVRPVHLLTYVDGRYLTTYVADALIASTATGSTAYALAAGGPILPPELRNILLVAVAPHLSIDRAIVLAEGSAVTITVQTTHQAVMSPDGLGPIEMISGDRIHTFAAEHSVQFLRFQDPGYFYRNLTPHMSQNPSAGNNR